MTSVLFSRNSTRSPTGSLISLAERIGAPPSGRMVGDTPPELLAGHLDPEARAGSPRAQTASGRASARAHSRAAGKAAARGSPRRPRRSAGPRACSPSERAPPAHRVEEKADDRQPDEAAGDRHDPEELGDLARFLAGRIERRLDAGAAGTSEHAHRKQANQPGSPFRNPCVWKRWRAYSPIDAAVTHKRADRRVVAPRGLAAASNVRQRVDIAMI